MRIVLAAAYVWLSFGPFAAAVSAADTDSGEHYKKCTTTAGEVRIQACTRFIAMEKVDKGKLSDAYYHRGRAFKKRKNYDRAIVDYTNAISQFPLPRYNYERGNIFLTTKQFDKAIADYSHALRHLPQHFWAYNNRGIAYANIGQYEHAIADYAQAVKHNPRPMRALNNRALAYLSWGKPELGLPDIDRALGLAPQVANFRLTRARLLEALGRRRDAIADYRKVLSIDGTIQSAIDRLKELGERP